MRYKVEPLAKEDVYYIRFTLGFRIEPRVNYFFELVLEDLVKKPGKSNGRAATRRFRNTTFQATCALFSHIRF